MKKYTANQINHLTWHEWNELMAKELNDAGFKAKEFDGTKWERTGKYSADPYEPQQFKLDLDVPALNYLKQIGLVNNGRCMECGNPINGSPGRFTNGFNHDFHYQICQDCARTRGGLLPNDTTKGGCMVTLLLLPLALIRGLLG